MARKFGVAIDLQKNELQNARVQNLASAPGSPVAGQIYYDTTANVLYWYNANSTSWIPAQQGASFSYGTVSALVVGGSNVDGVSTAVSRADHLHALPAFGTVTAQTSFGASSSNGAAGTFSRSDHAHGTPVAPTASSVGAVANNGGAPYLQTGTAAARPSTGLTIGGVYVDNDDFLAYVATSTTVYSQIAPFAAVGAIVTQAIGDAAAAGTATTYARGDHRHGMPAFGAVTAQTSYGSSSANGSAATIARSDHVHGTPSLTSNTPSTQAIGDSAVVGVGTAPARDDHKHAMPSFGAVTSQTSFGAGSSSGAAATIARSDHTHGTPTHDAAAHSAIPLNALATATGNYSMGTFLISTGGTPAAAGDLTTKAYVDSVAAGNRDTKDSVRVASTANVTLASGAQNASVIDGVTLATGDRILLKSQTAPAENGIYTVNASGAPTRAVDADASGEISSGTQTYVESGTANGGQIWIVNSTTATPWVPGSSGSTWTMYFAITATQAGAGLTASGNVLAVGQSTGIVVNADNIAVDRATNGSKVAMIFAQDIGDGSSTSFVITHNLGTRDVIGVVFPNSTPWDEQEYDIEHTSTTTVTVRFSVAPATNAYRVVVFG